MPRGNAAAKSATLRAGIHASHHGAHLFGPGLERAWRITEELIRMMCSEAQSHGAEFWLVTLTNGPQVYPDITIRNSLMVKFGVDSLLYPNLRIHDLAGRLQIPIITLAIPMGEYALKTHTFLHGFSGSFPGVGHWNEEGHRVAAATMALELGRGPAGKPTRFH